VPTNSDYGHKFSTGHFKERTRPLSPATAGVQVCLGGAIARTWRLGRARTRRQRNQVFSGRPLYQQGRLGVPAMMRADGLLPVALAPSAAPAPNNADADDDAGRTIVRELGEVGVRIEGHLTHLSLLTRKN